MARDVLAEAAESLRKAKAFGNQVKHGAAAWPKPSAIAAPPARQVKTPGFAKQSGRQLKERLRTEVEAGDEVGPTHVRR